ncbi:hypothetical protein A3G55_02230 [Candidatus Giovannonibacteria bacterium RIFCSPLOWO2_12_FULL_44_25]|nr:MAG: hypothetical protein UW15_C0001G0039 [Parcubacteria group bacterium GW2011_GWC1_44_10]OGF49551.1 MAG: hypothetical protein A2120_01080 [Candidatus Giovannonibacteria bacterium GWA2_45_15]OGF60051.1 MAG: hypothetical protein A2W40_00625 [Candidatus Giovannonibacteria bacterium RIFCSPHIGHO2_01_45_12]OGF60261.1 MAG: hypothetical protein A2656_00305 [Candidatus Giovannonibacteria bacterium RIFCSPHIGHO2_01_FULL_44_100]OGF71961.1 MAG: hypothetical protein A3C05_00430 [Candidatus Giovannonibac
MQRIKPAINSIYHVFNRGVEKRDVFLDDRDRQRFVFSLFAFNDISPVLNHNRLIEVGLPSFDDREKMVEIWAFALMPNHFHLMLKQLTENGITEFMRKIGTGYTNYFNLKYQRAGHLFQGKYKFSLISEMRHYTYLPFYIHMNPLSLTKNAKEIPVNPKKAIQRLEQYKWSSHLDYIGKPNFPSVIDQTELNSLFGGPSQYKNDFAEWIKNKGFKDVDDIAID